LALVYWETGCRISEILGLKWTCVGADFISIENARVQVAGGMADNNPKNAGSRRKINVTPECIALINKQPKNTTYVFTTANGKPIRQRNWRRQWDQWLITAFGAEPTEATTEKQESEEATADGSDNQKGEKKAKEKEVYRRPLVKVTPHSLRHLQAVRLFDSGWTIADVQARGGWESPKVLVSIYSAHSTEKKQRDMAEAAKFTNGC
jgi:integrase